MAKWANILGATAGVPYTIQEIITYNPSGYFVNGTFLSCPIGTVVGWTYDSVAGFLAPSANYEGNESYFVFDAGSGTYIPDITKKTDLIIAIVDLLNANASVDIETTFTYSGVDIDLKSREWSSINTNYILKSTISYPLLIKGINVDDHLSVASSAAFDTFFVATQVFIRGILDAVKGTEATLGAQTMANLLIIYDALK